MFLIPITYKTWYYFSLENKIVKSTYPDAHLIGNDSFHKILATTDPKLIADGIPSISEEFLQEYVRLQGKGKIMVEMGYSCVFNYFTDDCTQNGNCECKEKRICPKLDQTGNAILSFVPEIDLSICSVCGLLGQHQCDGRLFCVRS